MLYKLSTYFRINDSTSGKESCSRQHMDRNMRLQKLGEVVQRQLYKLQVC